MDKPFVLDNKVAMSWCFGDQANDYGDAVREKLTTARALVPAIWALEVAYVLLVAERKDRIKQAESTRSITLLLVTGRSLSLSSYDLAYRNLA